jgi:hypothetical protein
MRPRFEKYALRADGEPLFRLLLDGKVVREGMTIDQVVAAINRRDEERLGDDHSPRAGEGRWP